MSDGAMDQRAPDQDAAMEAAFVAGTLPEEDRREPEIMYEWIRRGDGEEILYTNGQIEHDASVIGAQRARRSEAV